MASILTQKYVYTVLPLFRWDVIGDVIGDSHRYRGKIGATIEL